MLVTVTESAKKACHQCYGRGVHNAEANCDGPRCMAWRWGEWERRNGDIILIDTGPADCAPVRGYCGLAGKP